MAEESGIDPQTGVVTGYPSFHACQELKLISYRTWKGLATVKYAAL